MTLDDIHKFYFYCLGKSQGVEFPPEDVDATLDFAQMGLFNDYYDEFGKSQRLNDALAPFKGQFQFTNVTSPTGLITMPGDYAHLLSVVPTVFDSVRQVPKNLPCPIINEDEKAARDASQIYPPTPNRPYGMIVQNWNVQLYPQVAQAGTVFYLKRPPKPKFAYGVVSGRVIVYDPSNSVQLAWAEKDVASILVKALSYAGLNMLTNDVLMWAQGKDTSNINTKDKL
ncbi:MAG TPA: hypothetical protein VGZ90_13370 [Puia sp.]|jgi:hypothetical protein|nr:hypothetical protein [Puia sp.]